MPWALTILDAFDMKNETLEKVWGKTFMVNYPMAVVESKEETQNSIRNFAAQRLLEVDLVSVDHLSGVLRSPRQNDESQMILNHGDHGVRNVFLFLGQTSINILFESL
jgi:hypothetical protein